MSRAAKKELTTAQLLETAKAVFLERGYHRATLDDIADAAGLTKGAVYARYSSKDQLFLALIDQRYANIGGEFVASLATSASFADWLHQEARRVIERRRREGDWYLLLLEFWIHAARDPMLRRTVAERHNRVVELLADAFTGAKAKFGIDPKWPAAKLARAGNVMLHGYTLERVLDPERVPERLIESMFELLINQVVTQPPKAMRNAPKGAGNDARRRNQRRKGNESNTVRRAND